MLCTDRAKKKDNKMNAVQSECVNLIAEGNVLSLEYRNLSTGGDTMIGTIRTTGSYGVLYRFRSTYSEEILREAYRTNKTIRFNATIEEDVLHLSVGVRLLADACTRVVVRSFGDPEPFKDVECGQSMPCKFHNYVTTCQVEETGLRRHKNTCCTYGGPQTCTIGMVI